MRRLIIGIGVILTLVCFFPSVSQAETDPHTTGWIVELGLAANGATNTTHESYGYLLGSEYAAQPLLGLSLAVLRRPIRYLSVGLLMYYGFFLPDVPKEFDAYDGVFGVLAELRGHVPIGIFDPWVGVSFGYLLAHSSLSVESLGTEQEVRNEAHGMGIGVGLGLNFFVTDTFSLGPFFRMLFGVWSKGCTTSSGTFGDGERHCSDVEDPVDPDVTPHYWTVGLSFTSNF